MTLATLAEASSNIVETMLKGKVLMYVTTGDLVTQRKFYLRLVATCLKAI